MSTAFVVDMFVDALGNICLKSFTHVCAHVLEVETSLGTTALTTSDPKKRTKLVRPIFLSAPFPQMILGPILVVRTIKKANFFRNRFSLIFPQTSR